MFEKCQKTTNESAESFAEWIGSETGWEVEWENPKRHKVWFFCNFKKHLRSPTWKCSSSCILIDVTIVFFVGPISQLTLGFNSHGYIHKSFIGYISPKHQNDIPEFIIFPREVGIFMGEARIATSTGTWTTRSSATALARVGGARTANQFMVHFKCCKRVGPQMSPGL